ncbi:MAG TPA: hypothetical protein VMM13_10425 [Euzebya sp.]|nr:hypothetical protein [Euzebya sp.]
MHVQLLARLDDLARREGLIAADTRKARIYRDPVGGTVAWLPHGAERLELTLIQVRMAAEQRAQQLHQALAQASGRTVADIPAHDLGLDAEDVVSHWPALERDFFPAYLRAHREVQADR